MRELRQNGFLEPEEEITKKSQPRGLMSSPNETPPGRGLMSAGEPGLQKYEDALMWRHDKTPRTRSLMESHPDLQVTLADLRNLAADYIWLVIAGICLVGYLYLRQH